jgi:hypothetical protein
MVAETGLEEPLTLIATPFNAVLRIVPELLITIPPFKAFTGLSVIVPEVVAVLLSVALALIPKVPDKVPPVPLIIIDGVAFVEIFAVPLINVPSELEVIICDVELVVITACALAALAAATNAVVASRR